MLCMKNHTAEKYKTATKNMGFLLSCYISFSFQHVNIKFCNFLKLRKVLSKKKTKKKQDNWVKR